MHLGAFEFIYLLLVVGGSYAACLSKCLGGPFSFVSSALIVVVVVDLTSD